MTPPEPVLAASDEGSPPRRRLDSMIAGRRRASDAPSRRSKPDETTEEKPARPSRATRPAAEQDGGEDDRPRVRRARRSPQGRSRGEAEAGEETKPAPAAEAAAEVTTEDAPEVEERPARRRRREPAVQESSNGAGEIADLREAVARQEAMLAELREGIDQLGTRIVTSGYRPRVAVFVDVPNLIYGYEGDGSLNMGKLLNLITEGRDLVRATAYSPVSDDPREPVEQQRFVAPFVPHEYRIVTKPLKRFSDGSIKGNFDVEMAVDMVMMADRVDVICIVSGDADFARAVEVVQQKGVRVEVVAFAGSTSIEMRALADHYFELDRAVKQIL